MDDKVKEIQERLRATLSQTMAPADAYRDVPIMCFEEVAGMPEGADDLVYRVTAELTRRGWRVVNLRRFAQHVAPSCLVDTGLPYLQAHTGTTVFALADRMVCVQPCKKEPSLAEMLAAVEGTYDVVIGESFGFLSVPKILLSRKVQEGFNLGLPNICGYVSDFDAKAVIPRFFADDEAALADFIEQRVILPHRAETETAR